MEWSKSTIIQIIDDGEIQLTIPAADEQRVVAAFQRVGISVGTDADYGRPGYVKVILRNPEWRQGNTSPTPIETYTHAFSTLSSHPDEIAEANRLRSPRPPVICPHCGRNRAAYRLTDESDPRYCPICEEVLAPKQSSVKERQNNTYYATAKPQRDTTRHLQLIVVHDDNGDIYGPFVNHAEAYKFGQAVMYAQNNDWDVSTLGTIEDETGHEIKDEWIHDPMVIATQFIKDLEAEYDIGKNNPLHTFPETHPYWQVSQWIYNEKGRRLGKKLPGEYR